MKFSEKLKQLTKGKKLAFVAEEAAIKPGLLNNYINRGSEPGAYTALKIAKTLHVPLEWLVDDAAEWPPQTNNNDTLESIDDNILMFEVCARHRRELVPFIQALDSAERTDWQSVLRDFSGWNPGDPLPNVVKDLPKSASFRWGLQRIQEHNPWIASAKFHSRLRGAERPFSEFQQDEVLKRYDALTSRPAFLEVMKLFEEHEHWTFARVREEFKKSSWQQQGRGFAPMPVPPAPAPAAGPDRGAANPPASPAPPSAPAARARKAPARTSAPTPPTRHPK